MITVEKYPIEAFNIKLEQNTFLPRMTHLHEVAALIHFMQQYQGNVVELGCGVGVTTNDLIKALPVSRNLYAVDFSGNVDVAPEQRIEVPRLGNTHRIGEAVKYASSKSNLKFIDEHIDDVDFKQFGDARFFFIDDDHTYAGVKATTKAVFRYIEKLQLKNRQERIVFWHDFSPYKPEWVKVHKFIVEDLVHEKIQVIEGTQLAYFKFTGVQKS